tara:strand:+ start:364 stop:843 length:480 start_codon:yes stop_codon:yes gene_type:complete
MVICGNKIDLLNFKFKININILMDDIYMYMINSYDYLDNYFNLKKSNEKISEKNVEKIKEKKNTVLKYKEFVDSKQVEFKEIHVNDKVKYQEVVDSKQVEFKEIHVNDKVKYTDLYISICNKCNNKILGNMYFYNDKRYCSELCRYKIMKYYYNNFTYY